MRRIRSPKIKANCETCSTEMMVWQSRIAIGKGRFCSTSCGKKGALNRSWNGGVKSVDGYRKLLIPGHPQADIKGYVPEHRVVVEKFIGRFLQDEQVVHHKNGVRSDNRIGNLKVCVNQSEHMIIHRALGVTHRWETAVSSE